MKYLIGAALIACLALFSCEKPGTAYCNDFSLTVEKYWISEKIGETITFTYKDTLKETFTVTNKDAYHVTDYETGTGYTCYDITTTILAHKSDTIVLSSELQYQEGLNATKQEKYLFRSKGDIYIFLNEDFTSQGKQKIDSINFPDVKLFKYKAKEADDINSLYFAKNHGIIAFSRENGEIWVKEIGDINGKEVNLSTFNYIEESKSN